MTRKYTEAKSFDRRALFMVFMASALALGCGDASGPVGPHFGSPTLFAGGCPECEILIPNNIQKGHLQAAIDGTKNDGGVCSQIKDRMTELKPGAGMWNERVEQTNDWGDRHPNRVNDGSEAGVVHFADDYTAPIPNSQHPPLSDLGLSFRHEAYHDLFPQVLDDSIAESTAVYCTA